ncbi:hypothetical protein RHMOL_Rhmol06G0302600 [Rhododendron molle]|uniref:Uncharacterized protein n=1 Tax=Rhododendron molle TaxID=49168 RepID=A0ACC0NHY9_RHOML|nr:hypothetical protein RHMOL_Rhmol06G0302600 [Rhododendron molle]
MLCVNEYFCVHKFFAFPTYCGSWKILMMGRCSEVEGENEAAGVKKAPGCSSIEVDGHVHEFLVGDGSHRKMKEVHAMLERA